MRISDEEITVNIKLVLNGVMPGIVDATNAMLDLQDARVESAKLKELGAKTTEVIECLLGEIEVSDKEFTKLADEYRKLGKDIKELVKCIEDLRGGV
jgi:hypothetical protein